MSFRYAICNETFEGWDHARVCGFVAECGYGGLEIAPFTLAPRITEVSSERRERLRSEAESAGVEIIGLHWLLAKTEGFMLTSPDVRIRAATANYLNELARACRDLGGHVLVLGSPQQRRIPAGFNKTDAMTFAVDTLERTLATLDDCGVTLALEPLAPAEADFLQTCDETNELIDRLQHSHVRLHLDVKAMSSEAEPIPELIRKHYQRVAHFHANDANRRGPGFGATDFRPIFSALDGVGYDGWVSVEVFDYSPDPETIAQESLRYMRETAAEAISGQAR